MAQPANKTMFVDLAQPITNNMPAYPNDELAQLEQIHFYQKDKYNNFRLTTQMHIGTHIDGPMHVNASDKFIGELDVNCLAGQGCLLNVVGEQEIICKPEYETQIPENCIVLLYTGFAKIYGEDKYYNEHPFVSIELAELFISKKIKMVCMDMPSPDYKPYEIHSLLLKHNVLIAENLTNLEALVYINKFEVIALPLKINADSSPARIVAKILE